MVYDLCYLTGVILRVTGFRGVKFHLKAYWKFKKSLWYFWKVLTNNESIVPNQEICFDWTKSQLSYFGYLGILFPKKPDQTSSERDLDIWFFEKMVNTVSFFTILY